MALKFYKNGLNWVFNDGFNIQDETAPQGNYRRQIKGSLVGIASKDSNYYLFNKQFVEVTTIQKNTLGDYYSDIAEFINLTEDFFVNAPTGGIVAGTVTNYEALPNPIISAGELWYVENPSGGNLTILGVYKYPKGIYTPNSENIWELLPINVKLSEDSLTLINITNWEEFINFTFDINIGDRIIYNNSEYQNLTGNQTTTPPNLDYINWQDSDESTIIAASKTLLNGTKSILVTNKNVVITLPTSPTINTKLFINNDSDGIIVLNGNGKLIYDATSQQLFSGESLLLLFINDKWNVI